MTNRLSEVVRIQEEFHRRLLDMRAFERILKSEDFEYAVLHRDSRLNELEPIIADLDQIALKAWIDRYAKDELEALSFRELREECKNHNIYRWSRLDKDQMVEALRAILVRPSQKSAG